MNSKRALCSRPIRKSTLKPSSLTQKIIYNLWQFELKKLTLTFIFKAVCSLKFNIPFSLAIFLLKTKLAKSCTFRRIHHENMLIQKFLLAVFLRVFLTFASNCSGILDSRERSLIAYLRTRHVPILVRIFSSANASAFLFATIKYHLRIQISYHTLLD